MKDVRQKKKEVIERIERLSLQGGKLSKISLSQIPNEESAYPKHLISLDAIKRVEEVDLNQENIKRVMESKFFNIIIMVLSFYSLFANDLKLLYAPASSDPVFSGIAIFIMMIFISEIILTTLMDEHYICSLYFFVDSVSTLTILLDISWISNNFNDVSSKVIAQIGRGGRLAARSIRLLRFVRAIKIITEGEKFFRKKHNESRDSNAGKMILQLTTKRVIFLIIMLIIAMIIFNINFYIDFVDKGTLSIQYFDHVFSYDHLMVAFNTLINSMDNDGSYYKLIYANIYNLTYTNSSYNNLTTMRSIDTEIVNIKRCRIDSSFVMLCFTC